MLSVLAITFPIFAMVALGYGLVARGVFRPEDMKVLGRYVMNLALPALVFQAVASSPIREVFNLSYMAIYLTGALGTMLLAFLWFSARTDPARRGVAVMGTTCPNSGFIGYPLMLILFPDLAGRILAMNMLIETVAIIPLALILIELGKPAGAAHPLARARQVLLGVVRRPLMIGMLAGLAVSFTGVALPGPVERVASMLAASAAALALLVIGGALVGLPLRGNRALAGQIAAGKLLGQTALTVLALVGLGALGLGLEGDLRAAVILSAAMPMFTIYAVFAQEVGQEGLASLAQLMATAAAFFTLNLLIALLV
ncbi:MAG: transporter [Alphaproteobacteria bacterium]|nr:MAG: transporter [Alphaproteobacteria bacterium]